MTAAISTRRITFKHPFVLPDMILPHPPGTFDLVEERIALDVSWEAYRISCRLMLADGGATSAFPVTTADIEAALLADSQR